MQKELQKTRAKADAEEANVEKCRRRISELEAKQDDTALQLKTSMNDRRDMLGSIDKLKMEVKAATESADVLAIERDKLASELAELQRTHVQSMAELQRVQNFLLEEQAAMITRCNESSAINEKLMKDRDDAMNKSIEAAAHIEDLHAEINTLSHKLETDNHHHFLEQMEQVFTFHCLAFHSCAAKFDILASCLQRQYSKDLLEELQAEVC